MKRAVAAALALALVTVPTAASARSSITASPGAVTLGEAVTLDWSFRDLRFGESLWARVDCVLADGSVGLTTFERLDDPEPDIVTAGHTATWTDGGASCTASLLVIDFGAFRYQRATTTFEVTP